MALDDWVTARLTGWGVGGRKGLLAQSPVGWQAECESFRSAGLSFARSSPTSGRRQVLPSQVRVSRIQFECESRLLLRHSLLLGASVRFKASASVSVCPARQIQTLVGEGNS